MDWIQTHNIMINRYFSKNMDFSTQKTLKIKWNNLLQNIHKT